MDDTVCYALYLFAFLVILHIFWTNRNTATGIFMEEEEEESWWPWRITVYNEWPNWGPMKSERVSDASTLKELKDAKALPKDAKALPKDSKALPKASKDAYSRPWGDPSARSANGLH